MTTVVSILWLLALLAVADCARRPGWLWRAADRDRAFWAVALVVLGPFAIWFYAAVCLPTLVEAGAEGAADSKFLKG